MRRLSALAGRILDDASTHDELRDACVALFALLSDVAGAPAESSDSALPSGLALAPASAAQCILDTNRTVAYVRGLWCALRELRRRDPRTVIEVVYAGTGPFAPLVLPLMAFEEMGRVRFTLIDIHEASIASVTRLVEHFNLQASVRDIVHCDAATYMHPLPIDVAVTETLQQSLKAEPFVAIVRNLRAQLARGGIIVPARVAVNIGTVAVFEVTTQSEVPAMRGERSESVVVHLPPGRVALSTTIDVFDGIKLAPHESGLTTPEVLWALSGETRDAGEVAFHYEMGGRPGIRWELQRLIPEMRPQRR